MQRETGILLHPTSLPGPYGIGDLGPAARQFADNLSARGDHLWQVLPLNYPGFGNSPYNALSAFAGNPWLLSPDDLLTDGFITAGELSDRPVFKPGRVDFPRVMAWKESLLRSAFSRFAPCDEYKRFCSENADWLEDFALYLALKKEFGGTCWNSWGKSFRQPQTARKMKTAQKLTAETDYAKFCQYLFAIQWSRLREYVHARGLEIIGDLPIYVAYDSADVWSHRECFRLDFDGNPAVVAGVPPDYFSETGQLWGNPIYHWQRLRESGYEWWMQRLGYLLRQVDRIRIDHFIGFERYWAIPFGDTTAIDGHWEKGPSYDFFAAVTTRFPGIRIIAEDLGLITPEVVELKNHFGFPGMKVLHFLFFDSKSPIDFEENCLVYTGTHDNDTTLGWYRSLAPNDLEAVHRWMPTSESTVVRDLIALAHRSPARIVMIPMQDVLELDSEARMNLPGSASGNWEWRMETDVFPK